MASPISFCISYALCAFLVSFSIFLSSFNMVFAVGRGQTFHTVQVSSLLQSSVCTPSTEDHSKTGSLKVVHRHGPCHQKNQDQASAPSLTDILSHDQSRVESIQHRFGLRKAQNNNKARSSSRSSSGWQAIIPDKSGNSIGEGNYIVTVGFGTPKKDQTLFFDTGSGLTWIQCLPCVKCYKQVDPIFNPSNSKSYRNITCKSPHCSQLQELPYEGVNEDCAATTCAYGIKYADKSASSAGFLGFEKLTLTPKDVFSRFIFGCGVANDGLLSGSAGVLALDRGPLSSITQASWKYGMYFSYCLPTSTSTGTLTFGKGGTKSTNLKFTPLLVNPEQPTLYFVDLIGIKVGGQKLQIAESAFKTPGTILDSGTVISRLPPAAYAALRKSFREGTSRYKLMAKGVGMFDTCYDFTGINEVSVPTISFLFAGNVEVPVPLSGIMVADKSQGCLAFAGNSDASDVGIFGNVQQQTMDVVYDVAGGKIGFGTGGCS